MKRCTCLLRFSPCARAGLALALAGCLLGNAVPAWAQLGPRPFPAQAERATMVVQQPPLIQLDGQPARLSPGSRIHGMNNLLLLSGSLVGQSLLVHYVRNPAGEVQEVWVLTPAEAAQKLASQR